MLLAEGTGAHACRSLDGAGGQSHRVPELWPQVLAAALPCARMAALAEAAVSQAGRADSPHAHAAACRALWLRAALLQRHLEPGVPENAAFWAVVDSLMVRRAPSAVNTNAPRCILSG